MLYLDSAAPTADAIGPVEDDDASSASERRRQGSEVVVRGRETREACSHDSQGPIGTS